MLWGLYSESVSGDYGYLIGPFMLACSYVFLGCYEVGIYILGRSFNLRAEVGHLLGGENLRTRPGRVSPTPQG